MSDYTVHDEDGFARVYDEDEMITIRKGDLRALLDLATGSMDFGSGFWDNEQVEVARKIAEVLGVDPIIVTPSNFACQYNKKHNWVWQPKFIRSDHKEGTWYCTHCHHTDDLPRELGPPVTEASDDEG